MNLVGVCCYLESFGPKEQAEKRRTVGLFLFCGFFHSWSLVSLQMCFLEKVSLVYFKVLIFICYQHLRYSVSWMKSWCWRGGVLSSVFWHGEVCCLLLAGLSWCAVRGSMLFPRIPAACSWGSSALILSFICFLLDVTQALGWTLAFCVLEKITKPSSVSRCKWKTIEGKKNLELFFACEALRGWASHCCHLWRGAGEPRAASPLWGCGSLLPCVARLPAKLLLAAPGSENLRSVHRFCALPLHVPP